jgi:hypothetical protein
MAGTSLSTVYMFSIVCATLGGIAAAFISLKFSPIPTDIEVMNEKRVEDKILSNLPSIGTNTPQETVQAPVSGEKTDL